MELVRQLENAQSRSSETRSGSGKQSSRRRDGSWSWRTAGWRRKTIASESFNASFMFVRSLQLLLAGVAGNPLPATSLVSGRYVSKVFHALMRSRLITAIAPARPPGLLGGFPPRQQVTFASHRLRTFTTVAAALKCSTAVLFVDVSSAYHHLVRALAMGGDQDQAHDLQNSMSCLRDAGRHLTEQDDLLTRLSVPACWHRLMKEIHTDTWFAMPKQTDVARTSRGSRPGSPLADCAFHCLMIRIAEKIDVYLRQHPTLIQATELMKLPAWTLTWADDMAVELASQHAEALVPLVQDVAAEVNDLYLSFGLTLNLQKGKTTAVLSFKGTGAPQARQEHLLCAEPGCLISSRTRVSWKLNFSTHYQHLGTQYVNDGKIEQEVNSGLGQAFAAFSLLRRPVLCNRHLALRTRLQLLDSLVLPTTVQSQVCLSESCS